MRCVSAAFLTVLLVLMAEIPMVTAEGQQSLKLADAVVENIVRRSYQYVAAYDAINKTAEKVGGWNKLVANKKLLDHTVRIVARPNNDTFYVAAMLDLRKEPVILEIPAIDSDYVSLMVSAYDHYVSIPLSTRLGDFREPARILFHSARTEGYDGAAADGVDHIFEATGDFVEAVIRIMPHANDPARFATVLGQIDRVRLLTLSEYRGGEARQIADAKFPSYGEADLDVFGDNLLEVMQFVFNHTTFDPANDLDRAVLSAYKPLGVYPGHEYDSAKIVEIDAERFRETAMRIQRSWLAALADRKGYEALRPRVFQPKGKTDLEALLAASVIGPIGLPQEEAVYPQVPTADGKQMNAKYDYVVRMSAEELPPAKAFWSLTLYDLDNGFFIPNERRKYSVGQNAGMKLDGHGGIEIHIAAEKPEGIPEENWLPITRSDLDLNLQFRFYVPDLARYETWKVPMAERVSTH